MAHRCQYRSLLWRYACPLPIALLRSVPAALLESVSVFEMPNAIGVKVHLESMPFSAITIGVVSGPIGIVPALSYATYTSLFDIVSSVVIN